LGFDTFSGFPRMAAEDAESSSSFASEGGLAADGYEDIRTAVKIFDMVRYYSHIPKIEVIRGDATETIPEYLKTHPHTVVSLLYLDFDIYEPTKLALEFLLPRIPKGGVIGFDEVNLETWPGETRALMEAVGVQHLRLERFSQLGTSICYAVRD
jgi:hypothetical protein